MRKAISPVVSVILLIVMTIGAAALAFFWITGVQSNIQETVGGNVEGSAGGDCTRLNLISIRGDGAVVQNVGCDTISSVNFFINGVLTSYDLEQPLAPGQAATINYLKQSAGDDLTVMVVLDNGVKSSLFSPADYNTPQSGFTNAELKYYYNGFEELGDWMGNITDLFYYTGAHSITYNIETSSIPGIYPLEFDEIVNISFYSYIPSKDYTGYLGPFFVYFDIVSLEEPQEVYYEHLYMSVGAGNEGYFTFFYYEVGAPWPPMGPPEGYDELDFTIPYDEWFKVDMDVLNSRIRFNEGEWQSISIDFSNANSIALTDFFTDDLTIWYYDSN